MMSSEQESYTSNICHQVQVSTTCVSTALCDTLQLSGKNSLGLAQRNRCGLMRLTGFLK